MLKIKKSNLTTTNTLTKIKISNELKTFQPGMILDLVVNNGVVEAVLSNGKNYFGVLDEIKDLIGNDSTLNHPGLAMVWARPSFQNSPETLVITTDMFDKNVGYKPGDKLYALDGLFSSKKYFSDTQPVGEVVEFNENQLTISLN